VVEMSNLTLQEQLEGYKRIAFIEENAKVNKNNDNNITKIEIKVETQDYKESNIFRNKIYSKDVHSNFDKGVARGLSFEELKKLKRGDIVWVDLRTNVGSEQRSDENGRPVVIIQNDIGNAFSPTIITACITSQMDKPKLPIHVQVPSDNNGLSKNSIVLTEQIMTLDKKKRILRKTGSLSEDIMIKIDRALSISIFPIKEKTPLERLPKTTQNIIKEKLEDIRSIERTICNIIIDNDKSLEKKLDSLEENLRGQRACYLASLERICKKYNLNYRDYYIMYKREKEDERIVV
jgi:mRNA interferase MazF